MAGDWIKMRGNLWDDPRVSKLCDLTGSGEAAVVGGLYWLWATADQHTENGVLPGLTLRAVDRKTGVEGLGDALCGIGWLADHPEGVRIVNFDEHNGTSAKRRSMDAQRKASVRSSSASDADKTPTPDGQSAPTCGAREEKSREEEIPSEAKASDGKPSKLTPEETIFTYGVPLLVNAGSTDKAARSFLGGLRKAHGDTTVVNVLRDCIRTKPLQPLEWLAKALPPAHIGGKQTALERDNAAVAAELAGHA